MKRSVDSDRFLSKITVAAVIKNNENKYLMVEENTSDGIKTNQPAGHLEENESLQEACIRETLEETGYLVEALYLVGVYHEYSSANREMWLRFCFACKVIKKVENFKIDDKNCKKLVFSEPVKLSNIDEGTTITLDLCKVNENYELTSINFQK